MRLSSGTCPRLSHCQATLPSNTTGWAYLHLLTIYMAWHTDSYLQHTRLGIVTLSSTCIHGWAYFTCIRKVHSWMYTCSYSQHTRVGILTISCSFLHTDHLLQLPSTSYLVNLPSLTGCLYDYHL